MPVQMLGARVAPHVPSLHLSSVRRETSRVLIQAFPTKLTRTSILELQFNHGKGVPFVPVILGFPLRAQEARRSQIMSLQSGPADETDKVTIEEQKVPDTKNSGAETEESGPPVLTIVAGIFVAVLVFWGIWSFISSIAGLFFR